MKPAWKKMNCCGWNENLIFMGGGVVMCFIYFATPPTSTIIVVHTSIYFMYGSTDTDIIT